MGVDWECHAVKQGIPSTPATALTGRRSFCSPKIGRFDDDNPAQLGVVHPGADTIVDCVWGAVRRDDSWEAVVVPVIEKLVQLFLRPAGITLFAKIVKHEEVCRPHRLECLIVRGPRLRRERRA
jgi:hypothetical protein